MNSADLFKAFGEIDEEALERSEIMENKKIVPLRRRVVMAVAAALAVVVLMGAAAVVNYSDSIQNWFANEWSLITGQKMSEGQANAIDRLSQEVGLSQTADGVTVTVDSATVGDKVMHLLLRFENAQWTDEFKDAVMMSMDIEVNSMSYEGGATTYRELDDGTVAMFVSVLLYEDSIENTDVINVKLSMSDSVEIIDDRIVAGETKWNFAFDLRYDELETIVLPDTQVMAISRLEGSDEETTVPVIIKKVELTSLGVSLEYEFEYETAYDREVSFSSIYHYNYFVAVLEDGSKAVTGGVSITGEWVDGTASVVSNIRWMVPIDLDEVVEIHIGDTVIPVK